MKTKNCSGTIIIVAAIYVMLISISMPILAQRSAAITTYLDSEEKEVKTQNKARFTEERWQEKGAWKARLTFTTSGALMAEYGYADGTRNLKEGLFVSYGSNRRKTSEITYRNGVIDGPFAQWQPDGTPIRKGNQTGEMIWGHYEFYNAEGKLKLVFEMDNAGNGTGIEYMTKTGVKGEGPVKGGKQHGAWIYLHENGKKVMEVVYNMQDLVSETCFDEKEQPLAGDCKHDRPAEFPGGADAWAQFLKKNLRFPKSALKNNITGIVMVKFLVKADGSVTSARVISSPDADLSEEALRVLALSPKWVPAVETNQVVPFMHTQAITFALR
jgi:TonB family protein